MKSLKLRINSNAISMERGFMAAEWIAGIAFLLIPTFIVVFSLLQIPARKNLTQVAAAAAARAYVQVQDQSQADAAARAAAAAAIASEFGGNPGSDEASVNAYLSARDVDIVLPNTIAGSPAVYCPSQEITVEVRMPVPVTINPFDSGASWFSPGAKLSASATERIDDYGELTDSETEGVKNPSYPFDVDQDPPAGCPDP